MTEPSSSPEERSARTTRRRNVLKGLGTVGLTGVGVTTATGPAAGNQPNEGPVDGDTVFADPAELEAIVDDLLAERIGSDIPGATVAVVEGETPVLTKGYGYADAETETPVRAAETAFRVGSVAKLVTWTAVMQGVERGTLDLDENVNSYLDDSTVEIPDTYADPVTLRHLGTHTAGFESALDPEVVADPADLAPLETVLVDQRPDRVRPPGNAVGYSNYGAALAGHIVAEVHDTSFEEYVQSEIFDPLGMEQATFAQSVPDDHPSELASPHQTAGSEFTVPDPVFINFRPAGSMSATATDMARFMSAHLGDGTVDDATILERPTATEMHSQQYIRHPAVTNWRYGFREYGRPDANRVGHSGGTIYFESFLVLALEHDIGIFVNYNSRSESVSPTAVIDEILATYDLRPAPATPTRTTGPNANQRAKTVGGEYAPTFLPGSGPLGVMERMNHITVTKADNGRLVTETLGGRHEWVETAPYVYHEVDGTDIVAFEVTDGQVNALHLNSSPQGSYRPVERIGEQQLVTGSVVGGSLLGFAGSLLGWGGLSAWRRWNGRRTETDDTSGDAATGPPRETSHHEQTEEGFK